MKHKITSISAYLVLLCLLCVQHATAQETRKISLQEAIDLGISNSHLLKNNKAVIDEATAAVKEANERKLPDFSVSGSYLYLPIKPTINIKGDSAGGGPKVSQAMYGIASVSMPLFAGGKFKYGLESARYLEQAARLDADQNKEAVILNTVNAYSNLYKAKAAVEIVKDNLEQSNQRVKDFTSLEKNGLLARNDLLKAELQSSNIELALLDAENNLKLSSVNMALMLGLPEQTQLLPDSASFQTKATALKTLDEYEQLALMQRKEVGALSLRKKVADLGIKSTKADYYPSVALTAGYIAADLPGFLTLTNAVNVGVGVKYNLSSLWKTKSKIAQAEARVNQLTANQDMLTDDIRLQVNKAFQDYLLSQKKIQVYGKAVDQAEENYRITKNKYDNALATTTDLLDADIAQLQSKLNVTNAVADAVVAYNKLLQTTGILTN